MTISEAQRVQQQLTDKYVLVRAGVPELRRFEGLTGTVKTVNMNGRALVQFDGPVDISWYDIDPAYLQVVDQPAPKQAAGHDAKAKSESSAAAPPAAKAAPSGKSPLDLIRQQGGVKAAPAGGEAGGGAKPSPLDLIRQQGAPKAAAAPPAAPAAEPATSAAPAQPTAGMSPLDLIRKQGPAKR